MIRKIFAAFAVMQLALLSWAQTPDVKAVLEQIEQNNPRLQAHQAFLKGDSLRRKSHNNLPDPQVGFYYLPLGEHQSSDYTELQVSQTVQFPLVYHRQSQLIDEQNQLGVSQYMIERRDILTNARQLCLELVHLNKKIELKQLHAQHAQTVYETLKKMEESGQSNLLELNKSKIAWLQARFELQQLTSARETFTNHLKGLNGGKEVTFTQTEYSDSLSPIDTEAIWKNRMGTDPELNTLQARINVADKQRSVYRSMSLPNLTAGYNHQGVQGETYGGLYAGISIPLWSNAHKVKAAEQMVVSEKLSRDAKLLTMKTEFESLCQQYSGMLDKYNDYRITLDSVENESLLMKSYELGEISYPEYYLELHFYHQAVDELLSMEKELHLLRNKIFKHLL